MARAPWKNLFYIYDGETYKTTFNQKRQKTTSVIAGQGSHFAPLYFADFWEIPSLRVVIEGTLINYVTLLHMKRKFVFELSLYWEMWQVVQRKLEMKSKGGKRGLQSKLGYYST